MYIMFINTMKNKIYYTVWTISKLNIKIAESGKIDTLKYV